MWNIYKLKKRSYVSSFFFQNQRPFFILHHNIFFHFVILFSEAKAFKIFLLSSGYSLDYSKTNSPILNAKLKHEPLTRFSALWRFLFRSLVETYGSSLAIAYSTLGFDALLGVSLWPFQTLSCLPKNSDDEKPELVFKNLQTGFRHKNVDVSECV